MPLSYPACLIWNGLLALCILRVNWDYRGEGQRSERSLHTCVARVKKCGTWLLETNIFAIVGEMKDKFVCSLRNNVSSHVKHILSFYLGNLACGPLSIQFFCDLPRGLKPSVKNVE